MWKVTLNANLRRLHWNKTESALISALTLKFSKWGKYVTTKRYFKQFFKNDNKNCVGSVTCYSYATCYINVKSSKHSKAPLTNKSKGKTSREDSLAILGYDYLNSPKWSIETLTMTNDLRQILQNQLI